MTAARRSIWRRTLLVLALVAATPLIIVLLSPWYETTIEWRHAHLLESAEDDVRAATTSDEIARVAEDHGIRIRMLAPRGRPVVDVDHTLRARWADRVGVMGLSPEQRAAIERYDDRLPPLAERDVIAAARAGRIGVGCQTMPDGLIMVCERAVSVDDRVLHLQTGSPRSVRGLHTARYQLLNLTAQVGVIALLLGLFFAWQLRRPLHRLQKAVAERARPPVSTRAVEAGRWVEVAELATAFNALLAALDDHRRTKVEFMADVAHDIKNTAATVRACGDALRSDAPQTPERLARIGRALEASSARMSDQVRRFLDLARAEAGLPDAARQRFDLAERVAALVDDRRARPDAQGISIVFDGAPSPIEGVAEALDDAVGNVLDNAIDFARAGGGHVRVIVEPDGHGARIDIADDGPGIAAADLPRVFDRYFTRRDDGGGTGLGMAIARAVIEAHAGRITVQSPPEGGARFTIRV